MSSQCKVKREKSKKKNRKNNSLIEHCENNIKRHQKHKECSIRSVLSEILIIQNMKYMNTGSVSENYFL